MKFLLNFWTPIFLFTYRCISTLLYMFMYAILHNWFIAGNGGFKLTGISIYFLLPDPSAIVYQCWNIVFQLYIVGPVLYQCILRVYCSLIMCSLFASFFLKKDWEFLVLIPMMFIAKSWKIVKFSNKTLKFVAMHFLIMMMTYNVKTLQETY